MIYLNIHLRANKYMGKAPGEISVNVRPAQHIWYTNAETVKKLLQQLAEIYPPAPDSKSSPEGTDKPWFAL